jgi:hypothetical protein
MKFKFCLILAMTSNVFCSSQEFETILDGEKKRNTTKVMIQQSSSDDSELCESIEIPNRRNLDEKKISILEIKIKELKEEIVALKAFFKKSYEEILGQFSKAISFVAAKPTRTIEEITDDTKLRVSKKIAKLKGYAFDNEILFSFRTMKLNDVLQIERDLDIESSEFYQKNMVLKNKEIDDLKYKLEKSEAACNSLRLMILESSSSSNSSGFSRSNVVICEKCHR